jgi:AraC-like DNA-binding protein
VDPLSDVLELLMVESAVSSRFEAGGDWALSFGGTAHVKLGAVHRGSCWLRPDGGAAVRVREGDCYLLCTGDGFAVSSDPALETVDGAPAYRHAVDGIARAGTGDEVVMSGARFAFDARAARLLLDVLPPVLVIGADEPGGAPLRAALDLLGHESAAPRLGSALVTARLGQIVFVEALRAAVDAGDRDVGGWLGAMADGRIGAALGLMHDDPGRRWTVPELAGAVHMSRSAFAERFRALVGAPPLEHLLRLRMHAAGRDLRRGDVTVSSVAAAWGYGSDSAFSNAFKRVTGVAPSAWRASAGGRPAPSGDVADAPRPARRRAA